MQTNLNELDFRGNKCGHSYRIKITCIKTWDAFFYDWHEGGWMEIRDGGGHNRHEAIQVCNRHAVNNRLIKFLPQRHAADFSLGQYRRP